MIAAWHYVFAGLRVESDRPLAPMSACEDVAIDRIDLRLRRRSRPWMKAVIKDGPPRHWIKRLDGDRVVLAIEDFGVICASPGLLEWAIRHEADWREFQGYLLGIGLGISLYQLDVIPFHVSGCVVGGGAIAFSGTSGAGKSSMAYALASAFGGEIVSDDMTSFQCAEKGAFMFPGISEVRLFREVVSEFREDRLRARRDERTQKKYRMIGARRALRPVEVRALVWIELERGSDFGIRRVVAGERLRRWRDSLYAADFGVHLGRPARVQTEVLALASKVPVYVMTKGLRVTSVRSDCEQLLGTIERDLASK